MFRGDTPPITITVPALDGSGPFDLTGCTAWFTVKRIATAATDPDNAAVFQLSTIAGSLTIPAPASGVITGWPAADDTSDLTDTTRCTFDAQIRTPAGRTYTVADGILIIVADTTRA